MMPHAPTVCILAATITLFSGWTMWPSRSTPRQYLDQDAEDSILSPVGLICHVHSVIERLQASSPDSPVTLFSVLRLDPSEPPFHPADECASPYQPNYEAAKSKIAEAWAELTDNHDADMREWRDVFAGAAAVLLDDTSRTVYMKEVLPKIEAKMKEKGDPERGWKEVCDKKK
ncbi:hypothetical protein NM208_g10668 [Fusarium decemcellulare]|uniref:Uncharacterized protein n=1 Tax=Fusarium decemcellulare TaxID=57161 RepID=A0ACC1RX90_9HYPO|nr:hypothetical protein NM208_g10668 [Fusarium decemcellulare]